MKEIKNNGISHKKSQGNQNITIKTESKVKSGLITIFFTIKSLKIEDIQNLKPYYKIIKCLKVDCEIIKKNFSSAHFITYISTKNESKPKIRQIQGSRNQYFGIVSFGWWSFSIRIPVKTST